MFIAVLADGVTRLVAPPRCAQDVRIAREIAGDLHEGGQAPRSARFQMDGDARADDGDDGQAGRKDTERRKPVDARVGVEKDRGIEVLERCLERESLVVVGGGAAAITGGCEPLEIVDRHRAGRRMADGPNRQVGEVRRLIGHDDPRRGRRVGAEQPCAPAVGLVDGQRTKADGLGIGGPHRSTHRHWFVDQGVASGRSSLTARTTSGHLTSS